MKVKSCVLIVKEEEQQSHSAEVWTAGFPSLKTQTDEVILGVPGCSRAMLVFKDRLLRYVCVVVVFLFQSRLPNFTHHLTNICHMMNFSLQRSL